jgi:hypothetical protein
VGWAMEIGAEASQRSKNNDGIDLFIDLKA